MKENYVILIFIAVVFVVGFLIRKKYPPSNTYNFWISLVCIVVFSGMYIQKHGKEPFASDLVALLLYGALLIYFVFSAVKSYKLMHK
jgi:nicotinamide riboside transporter PnuC